MNFRSAPGLALVAALTLTAARAAAQEPDGKALYRQHCNTCHGAKGIPSSQMRSVYPQLKALADSGAFAKIPSDTVIAVIQHGKGAMKSLGGTLKPDQMAAIAKYIKTL
jgi:mono/diheme cytochrome c family protein